MTSRRFLSKRSLLIISLLALSGLMMLGPPSAHAVSPSVNVLAISGLSNPGFDKGTYVENVSGVPTVVPDYWRFETCEGVSGATIGLDSSTWTNGTNSVRVSTGPLYGVGCFTGPLYNYTNRAEGFTQLSWPNSSAAPSYNFTTLTDSPMGLSFWFKLQPYNGNGMAGFEIRIFGAEGIAELEYVINPDPSIGNFNNDTTTRTLFFYGYQMGTWYHFTRDLYADWKNLGLSLGQPFRGLQFEGLATKSGTTVKSETFWVDDVRAYVGSGPIPTEKYYTSFNFVDARGNDPSSLITWSLADSTGQAISYTLGQTTLSGGPYYLQVYYPVTGSTFLIYNQEVHLNTSTTIPLALWPDTLAGHYVALNNPATGVNTNRPDSTRMSATIQGPAGTQYKLLVYSASKPVLIQSNGFDLLQGYDWTYDGTQHFVSVSFAMQSGGENVSIFFIMPLRIPNLSFVDLTGANLGSKITFAVLDALGNRITYQPGAVLPTGNFFLEAYYQNLRVYRSNLVNIGTPPVILAMLPLDASKNSYLAVNSTTTSMTTTEVSSSQISFSFTGPGPYQVVLNVPQRPLYVEKDGTRIPDWIYNGTSQTVVIQAGSPGSFNVVFQQKASSNLYYIAGGVGGAAVIVVLGLLLWRSRRVKLSPTASEEQPQPKQTYEKKTQSPKKSKGGR